MRLPAFLFIVLATALATAGLARAETLSAPETRERVAAGTLVLIDARRPSEWRETGIPAGARPAAMHTALGTIRPGFVADVLEATGGDRDRPVAVICAGGVRSPEARTLLRRYGFTQVYDVAEGMSGSNAGPGWLARGLDVEPCRKC